MSNFDRFYRFLRRRVCRPDHGTRAPSLRFVFVGATATSVGAYGWAPGVRVCPDHLRLDQRSQRVAGEEMAHGQRYRDPSGGCREATIYAGCHLHVYGGGA